MDSNQFIRLAGTNVNEYVEHKNGLSYLSWAWAVDQLLRLDPTATWSHGEPQKWGDTVMVFCTVTAFGVSRTAQLPVMDHRNQAIANPDAYAVNTAMQRALTKSIALHGLGLYLYAGEDLPSGEEPTRTAPKVTALRTERAISPAQLRYLRRLIAEAKTSEQSIVDYFSLDRLEDLPMKAFDRVLKSLQRRSA